MDNEDENFPYRLLSENEQKLLILLFELESLNEGKVITKNTLVKRASRIFGKDKTESQIRNSLTNALRSIQKISKDYFGDKYNGKVEQYVISTAQAEEKNTGYSLAYEKTITIERTAKYGTLLVQKSVRNSIEKSKAREIGMDDPINMTSDEVDFNLERFVKIGYLSDEITKYRIEERLRLYEKDYLAELVKQFDKSS